MFCVLPCMSRGSHRELAINEGKSYEVQREHLPSFPLLDVVIAEVYQEHGLTWRPLSTFTTIFGIRVWTIATAAGASGGTAKGGRVGRSGLGHFTSSQIKENPRINLKWAWLIFRMWHFSWGRSAQDRGGSPTRLFQLGFSDDCRMNVHIPWHGPKGRNLIWKCSNRFGTGLTKKTSNQCLRSNGFIAGMMAWPLDAIFSKLS